MIGESTRLMKSQLENLGHESSFWLTILHSVVRSLPDKCQGYTSNKNIHFCTIFFESFGPKGQGWGDSN